MYASGWTERTFAGSGTVPVALRRFSARLRRRPDQHLVDVHMRRLTHRWLPPVRIYHEYPLRRMGVVT